MMCFIANLGNEEDIENESIYSFMDIESEETRAIYAYNHDIENLIHNHYKNEIDRLSEQEKETLFMCLSHTLWIILYEFLDREEKMFEIKINNISEELPFNDKIGMGFYSEEIKESLDELIEKLSRGEEITDG